MALKLEKLLPSGFTALYWRIDSVAYFRRERSLEVVLSPYKDEAVGKSDDGQPAGHAYILKVQGDDAEMLMAELHNRCADLLYSAIKELPDSAFAAAEDEL